LDVESLREGSVEAGGWRLEAGGWRLEGTLRLGDTLHNLTFREEVKK
jgi:hypothetical protein